MSDNNTYDLIVLGSGPGGYVAAVRAAQLGFKTACIERYSRLGGVCLNVGCIPSKALLDSSEYFHLATTHFQDHGIQYKDLEFDLAVMMQRKISVVEDLTSQVEQLLKNNNIEIIKGHGRLSSPNEIEVYEHPFNNENKPIQKIQSRFILLATGSKPVSVPGIEFDDKNIVSSTQALSFKSVPKKLGIIGGGYIGLELGSVWARLGSQVTVIEMMPQIAGSLDGQLSRTLKRILEKEGVQFNLNTKVLSAGVKDSRVEIQMETQGEMGKLEVDKLLVAVGRKPLTSNMGLKRLGIQRDDKTGHIVINENFQTSVKNIYAIGDLVPGPMLAHKASAEGRAAVDVMAGKWGEVNYDTLPSIVYTWPEVASVGLTEDELKKRKIDYCTGTYPFSGTGRARCMGEKEGFVKVLSHKKTDRLLGVHIIGPRASDMIAECVLAMELNASAEDITRTIHGHPTFSEAFQEAAFALSKCSIYAG